MPDADTLAQYRDLVKDTTIDSNTLLSTDYFNHFNEVIMLLSMLGDMPEMLDDIRAWQPKTYKQHFEGSGLGFASLAIDAYDHVPPEFREPFDRVVAELEATIAEAVVALEAELESPEMLGFLASDYWQRLQKLVDRGSAIVHGATEQATLDQDAIDALF
jgi:predicted Zn-dependent protease with MMP-like domain